MELTTSWKEEGIAIGRQEGWQREGQLILRQLQRRFGILTPEIEKCVAQLPIDKLEALGESLLDFASVANLRTWLAAN
jgi:hypothetical protein